MRGRKARNDRFVVAKVAAAFLGAFLMSTAVPAAHAAAVTFLSDALSMSRTAVPANHEISFALSNNAAEGQTLSVVWAAAFDATGMTENDIDVEDDGTQLSTAPDCAGAEAAGVSWAGNTLTILICPGDGGAIASGSAVVVKAGTNAINFGVGANRIVNPAAAGDHSVALGGTAGTSGTAVLAIVAQDTLDVTAMVAPHNPPGGSGSAGSGYYPPGPRISDLVIDQITASTARVSWRTDIASDSRVLYGLTASYGTIRGTDDPVLDHEVVLMGLAPGFIYHLQARSVDQFGAVGTSPDRTFSTLKAASGVAPKILNIRLESVTAYEAQVLWETDQPTYSRLEYGKTTDYGSAVETARFAVDHWATLRDLSPAVAYHFRIIAVNENGNQTISPDQAFTTFDTLLPQIMNIHADKLAAHSFDVVWTTDKPASGAVKYGETENYEIGEVVEADGFALSHRVTLSRLQGNTAYHYKIFQSDRSGNEGESPDQTARTLPDLVPPANPQSFAAVPGDRSVSLSWKNTDEADFGKVIVRRKTGDYPASIFDGEKIYEGPGTVKVDPDLRNDTTYYYRIFSVDKSGNVSTGSIARAAPTSKPGAKPPPPIVPDEAPAGSEAVSDGRLILAVEGVPVQIVGGILVVLPGSRIRVEIPRELAGRPIKHAYLRLGDDIHEFAKDKNGVYYTDAISPSRMSNLFGMVMIEYDDGSTLYSKWRIETVMPGQVFELVSGKRVPVAGAVVTLYSGNEPWDGSKYGQQNPQVTDKSGTYRLFVPKGTYYLYATKQDFRQKIGKKHEYFGPITEDIQLERPFFSIITLNRAQNWVIDQLNLALAYLAAHPIVRFAIAVFIISLLLIINRLLKAKKLLINK